MIKKLVLSIVFIILLVALAGYFLLPDKDSFLCSEGRRTVLSAHDYQGRKLSLHRLISGWHDKVTFLELYEEPIELGECNNVVSTPIYTEVVDYWGNSENDYTQRPSKVTVEQGSVVVIEYIPLNGESIKFLEGTPVEWID